MFKKLLNQILIALKAIPNLCAVLFKQLLKLLFASIFYALSLAFLLLGISIVGAHIYIFLKTGDWGLVASPDLPFTILLEAQWIGAWKIYSWLPASLIFIASSIGIVFLYLKLKRWLQTMFSPSPLNQSSEHVA